MAPFYGWGSTASRLEPLQGGSLLFTTKFLEILVLLEQDIQLYLTHIWVIFPSCRNYPAGIYLFKVDSRNTRTMCEVCSKLTIKTPERRHWRRSGVFIVNFEQISHIVLIYLLLTLNNLADWQMLSNATIQLIYGAAQFTGFYTMGMLIWNMWTLLFFSSGKFFLLRIFFSRIILWWKKIHYLDLLLIYKISIIGLVGKSTLLATVYYFIIWKLNSKAYL